MLKQYKLKFYNFRLVVYLIAISLLGVLLVGSAMKSLQTRQLAGVIVGICLMVIISLIDFSWILNFYWVIYIVNTILLVGIRFLGHSAGGATRWIDIGGFRFQPTEISKVLIILFFAQFFMKHEETLNSLKTLALSLVLLALPLALIASQPDLKNTITIFIIFLAMLFVAGLSYKIIAGGILLVVPLVIIFMTIVAQPDQDIFFLKDYQKERIVAWIYPDSEENADNVEQQNNSITAIGSGELTGKGLNNNEVSSANKGNYVSQIQTDFIFAVAGEELGFIGCSLIVLLLFLITYECIRMSRRSKDLSGTIICCGMAMIIAFQSFLNICVATGILPNTGTPLPFLSYGLSSLISLFIGMGLVLNVGLQSTYYKPQEQHKTLMETRSSDEY
ncbi:MAG: FtsW/RodA/SpoVE family cell cycle protein [Lachnospiraceae bacterium]